MWSPPFAATLGDQSSLQMIIGAMLIYSIPDLVKKFRTTFGGTSLLGDLNIGIGSLLVGAAPIIGAAKPSSSKHCLGSSDHRSCQDSAWSYWAWQYRYTINIRTIPKNGWISNR
jgi:hypothetical protein